MDKIIIPDNALVVLIGSSGCGKSTFVKEHFISSSIISSDTYREVITDDINNQECNKIVFDIVHKIVEARLQGKRLTVIDATNLKYSSRKIFIEFSKKYDIPLVYLVFDISEDICKCQNNLRSRQVPEYIIERHTQQLQNCKSEISKETDLIYYLNSEFITRNLINKIEIKNMENLVKHISDDEFIIIGDIHGCNDELELILDFCENDYFGTSLIFIGDLADRGPYSLKCIKIVMRLVKEKHAYMVLGNHDFKLLRYLKGNKIKPSNGLQATIDEINKNCSDEEKKEILEFLESLPYQIILHIPDTPDCIVTHAGIPFELVGVSNSKMKNHALFGEVSGKTASGFPNRTVLFYDSWQIGEGGPIQIHGHTVTSDPMKFADKNCYNIDTGCVFGGKLTAFVYPNKQLYQIDALKVYHYNVDDDNHAKSLPSY